MKKFFNKLLKGKALATEGYSMQGRRHYQQDDYYISEIVDDKLLCLVADGVGGHAHGEWASAKAMEIFKDAFEKKRYNELGAKEFLTKTAFLAAGEIFNKGKSDSEYQNTGTTLTGFFITNGKVFTINIGDSRVYYFSDKEEALTRLTDDHSYVNELVKEGLLSEKEAETHHKRNIITSSLGMRLNELKVDVEELAFSLQENDILIAVSDGVMSGLPDKELEKVIIKNKNEMLSQLIVSEAFLKGSDDNITAVIYRHS